MNKHAPHLNKCLSSLAIFLCFVALQYLCFCTPHLGAEELTADTLDFSLKTIDGTEVRLEDYRGKKIVHLLFWATWCPHCLMEMILLDEKGDVTKQCKIVGVPCHIIIGKDGTIIDRFNELPKDPLAYLNKYITPEDPL
jgi:thiol-disulfide isomerase/thioredoxin